MFKVYGRELIDPLRNETGRLFNKSSLKPEEINNKLKLFTSTNTLTKINTFIIQKEFEVTKVG